MNLLPVVQRELTQAARKPATFGTRISAAILGAVVSGIMLLAVSQLGRQLFGVLTLMAFVAAASAGVFLTADSLRSEKRDGTLGLLFLTDLRGYDIVLGKLASTSLNAFLALFALFPVLSVGWLLGGVGGSEFWRTCVALMATLIFSLSAGLAFSAQGKKHGEGMFICAAALVLFTVFFPLLANWAYASTRWAPIGQFFDINPWSCFEAAKDTGSKADPNRYWRCLWGTFAWSAGAAIFASWTLPRRFLDEAADGGGWSRSFAALDRSFAPKPGVLVYSLLDKNPVAALQARAPFISLLAWIIAILSAAAVILQAIYSRNGATPLFSLRFAPAFTAIGLGCLILLLAWQSCGFFREAKAAGLLELLATTPITDRSILRGQWVALARIFFGPFLVVLASSWIASAIQGSMAGELVLSLILAGDAALTCVTAAWAGAWFSLNDDRRQLSFLKTVAILFLPKILTCICPIFEPFIMLALFFYMRQRFVLGIRRIIIGPRQHGERSWQPMIEE